MFTMKERKAARTPPNTWYQGLGHGPLLNLDWPEFPGSSCESLRIVRCSPSIIFSLPQVQFNTRPSSPDVPRKFMALWILQSLINPYVRTYVRPYIHACIHRWMHTYTHTVHTLTSYTHTNKHSVNVFSCAYTHMWHHRSMQLVVHKRKAQTPTMDWLPFSQGMPSHRH